MHFWNGQLQLRMVLDQVLWRSMQEVFEGIRLATCAPCQVGQVHPQFETERGNLLRSPCKNWVNHVMMSINYKPRFMGIHQFCGRWKTVYFQKFSANCGRWTASYVILRQHNALRLDIGSCAWLLQAFQTFVSVLPMLQSFVYLSQVKVIVYIDESKFWTTTNTLRCFCQLTHFFFELHGEPPKAKHCMEPLRHRHCMRLFMERCAKLGHLRLIA